MATCVLPPRCGDHPYPGLPARGAPTSRAPSVGLFPVAEEPATLSLKGRESGVALGTPAVDGLQTLGHALNLNGVDAPEDEPPL